jgi:hypothetical protein
MKIREQKYELSLLPSLHRQKKEAYFFHYHSGIHVRYYVGVLQYIANSFADKFPIGDAQDGGYKIYIVIFMAIVVPLSCTSIVDQQSR